MYLQFNCPRCGLSIQAATDSAGGTAQCPECGQEFVVAANPPVMPVVRAQVVPVPAPPPANPSPPQHRPPAPQVRPGSAAPQHSAARSRFDAPSAVNEAAKEAAKDKLRFLGLAVAGGLLLIVAIWVTVLVGQPKPDPTQPTAAQITLQKQAAEEIVRKDREIKTLKDKQEAKAKEDAAIRKQKFDAETKVEEERLAWKDKQYKDELNRYAQSYFSGDLSAAESFIKARDNILFGLADLMRGAKGANAPKTKEEIEEYLIKRLILHIERDPVLSQWMKDHQRDPQKFIAEFVQTNPKRPGSGPPPNTFDFTPYASMGSGFLVSADGWVLTNEHVVMDAKVVDLRLHDGKMSQAKVVKTDEANDLALLKADLTAASWLAVSRGETDLPLGRTVFTVGYPDPVLQGVEPKFTDGRISAASGIGDRKDSYQTTVPVQHGNSGGPLVDFATGWVVGVVNARLESSRGVGADNVSYAIKVKGVSAFFDAVPEAKAAAAKTPPKPLAKGDERAVIERVTASAILILRRR